MSLLEISKLPEGLPDGERMTGRRPARYLPQAPDGKFYAEQCGQWFVHSLGSGVWVRLSDA